LRSLDNTVSDLAQKSSKLETIFEDQKVLLASTPSTWPVRGYLSSAFGNRIDPFTGLQDFTPGSTSPPPSGPRSRPLRTGW